MFMLNKKVRIKTVFVQHIMENIVEDMNLKKKVIKLKDINGGCI